MIPTQVYIAHFICEQTFVPHFFFFFFGKKKKKNYQHHDPIDI
jgi:hypothetical protein